MEKIMAIFDIPGMNAKMYDGVIADLNQQGIRYQKARQSHTAGPSADGWLVVDIWESPDALNEFAGSLVPILIKNGVQNPPMPAIYPIHHSM